MAEERRQKYRGRIERQRPRLLQQSQSGQAGVKFPELPADVVNKAMDMQLQFKIPAQSVKTDPAQWENLMKMQKYLGNVKGSIPFKDIIDNSYADVAMKAVK